MSSGYWATCQVPDRMVLTLMWLDLEEEWVRVAQVVTWGPV